MINKRCYVAGDSVVRSQVALRNVKRYKRNFFIFFGNFCYGCAESIAGHYDNVEAFLDCLFNGRDTSFGAITCGLKVFERKSVRFTESLACFVRGLVERLVGDIAVVGNHRNFHRAVGCGVVTGHFNFCRTAVALIFVLVARGEREATCNDSHNKKRYE